MLSHKHLNHSLHSDPKSDALESFSRAFPEVIRIEPAGVCNLRCQHCSTLEALGTGGLLSKQTFALAVESLKRHIDSIRVVVLYHGGEPLLHKDFANIVRQIKDLGVPHVKTISNGMLLTEKNMVELIESGLDWIEFSMDGESAAENDFIRVRGPFQKISKNIKAFIDCKRRMKSSKPEIVISNVQFLKKENVAAMKHDPVPPQYLIDAFSGAYAGEISKIKCNWARPWLDMGIDSEIFDIYAAEDLEQAPFCDHVESIVTVRWNGDVVPCCFDLTGKLVLGNIHKDSLEKIWNDHPYLHLRKSIKSACFNPVCQKCYIVGEQRYFLLKDSIRRKLEETNAQLPAPALDRH